MHGVLPQWVSAATVPLLEITAPIKTWGNALQAEKEIQYSGKMCENYLQTLVVLSADD